MRKPIRSREGFFQAHHEQDEKLRKYLLSTRGRKSDFDEVVDELKDGAARSLLATNTRARLCLFDHVRTQLEKMSRARNAAFITFAPTCFAMPVSNAPAFDHQEIELWTNEFLDEFNFVGMVDLAYYSNWSLAGRHREHIISWHAHVIAWNFAGAALNEIIADINCRFQPLVPGRTVAHVRPLPISSIVGQSAYALKAPLSEYRVYPDKGTPGNFIQRKRPLRPKDALMIYRILAGRTLPSMLLSGRAGVEIVESAATAATKEIESQDWEARKALRRSFLGRSA